MDRIHVFVPRWMDRIYVFPKSQASTSLVLRNNVILCLWRYILKWFCARWGKSRSRRVSTSLDAQCRENIRVVLRMTSKISAFLLIFSVRCGVFKFTCSFMVLNWILNVIIAVTVTVFANFEFSWRGNKEIVPKNYMKQGNTYIHTHFLSLSLFPSILRTTETPQPSLPHHLLNKIPSSLSSVVLNLPLSS